MTRRLLCLAFVAFFATPAAFGQSLNKTAVSFGNQVVGETSAARTINFKNTLLAPVTLLSVTVSGGQAADFAATPGCAPPAVLAPGKTCTLSVRFTPGVFGPRASSLVFAHDQPGSPLIAALTGTGVVPVTLSPSSLSFGNVVLGITSAAKTATLKNVQGTQLSIASITLAAPFVRQGGTCPAAAGVLAGGASCTIGIAYAPTVAGDAAAVLTVTHGASSSPQSVALSGKGVAPVTTAPTSLSFPSRTVGTTSSPKIVKISNKSGAVLPLGAITASGDFSVSSSTCGASLAAGAQCTIGVTFTPIDVGLRAGILSIVHAAFGSPLPVPLSGTGNVDGLVSIAVTPANPALGLGITQQFAATATYADGTTTDISATVEWEIGNPLRGRLTNGGQYLSLASGTNTVTARVGIVHGETTVTGARPVFSYKRTTATTLLDGRVLIAGGTDAAFNPTAQAELFDPATGTSTATAPMSIPRYGHSATRLPDGRVLVAGGMGLCCVLAFDSAEIFDPASGTWTPTGTLKTARGFHKALLVGSKVLLAAGYTGNVPLATAELFDPATGTFALTGSLATARWGHTATLLPDGRVFVVGGTNVGAFTPGVSLATAELYQPSTGTWTYGGAMLTARDSHSSTLLQNGTVLIAGGVNGSTGLTSAQLFDPATETWSLTGSLPLAMRRPVAALLPAGAVLLAGGGGSGGVFTAVYEPASGTFEAGPPLAYGRSDHAGAILDDGSVLLIGGYGTLAAGRTAADSAEVRTGAIVLTGLTVAPSITSAAPLSTVAFSAIGTFSDGSVGDVTSLSTWTATPESVATVSGPGNIHTEGPGTAIIRATFAGFVFDATLTVP